MKACLFLLFVMLSSHVKSQTYSWQDFVDYVQDDENSEEQQWTEQMEELSYLHDHPMDINTATRDDLRRLPMLDDEQIEDIHTYVFLHGGMRTLSELMAIESIDFTTRRMLSFFLYADQKIFEHRDTVNMKNLVKRAEHDLLTRMDIPLYYRAGYSYAPEAGGYKGSTLYSKVQYQLKSMNRVQMGVRAEKDQGEPFRDNRGFDSYGGYFQLKNIGHLRSLVLGDYKLGFGEGLVVNSGYSLGKFSLYGSSRGLRPYVSMDEHNFMRGAAVALGFGDVTFTVWASMRRWDATLSESGEIRTIQTSGLHRTLTELDRKQNARTLVAGGDATWRRSGIELGVTGYFQHFHRTLAPGDQLYRRYYPAGRNFGLMGFHYGYACRWFAFSGETAYSTEKQGLATFNKLIWKINSHYKLTGSQRFYSRRYYSFYASALSENSTVQNENGGMLRLDAQPVSRWTLMAYADFFYNPWPRYQMTRSSSGQDFVVQNDVQLGHKHALTVRYQLKRKEYSDLMQCHNRLRLKYSFLPSERLRLQSLVGLHSMNGRMGFAVSQNMKFAPQSKVYAVQGMFTYFHTPNYATRVYQYEPLLTNTFYIPALDGRGVRFSVLGHCLFWNRRLRIELKYAATCYFDRTTQSSGMQEIFSRWKNDLSVQVRLRV